MRFGRQIDVDTARERERDDQRRRHEEIGFDAGMDAGLEIAVAGEHAGGDEIVFHDGFLDRPGQRTGVADAGRAAVADEIEAQRVEIALQAGLVEVIGDDARPGARELLTYAGTCSPRSTAFFASSPAASMTLGLDVLVQLVMAAMTTEPWPICQSPSRVGTELSTVSGVGWSSRISDSLADSRSFAGSVSCGCSTGVEESKCTLTRLPSSSRGLL